MFFHAPIALYLGCIFEAFIYTDEFKKRNEKRPFQLKILYLLSTFQWGGVLLRSRLNRKNPRPLILFPVIVDIFFLGFLQLVEITNEQFLPFESKRSKLLELLSVLPPGFRRSSIKLENLFEIVSNTRSQKYD